VFSLLRNWISGTKKTPRPARGDELLAFLKLPAAFVSWAMARARQEYPVDLETLWQECPRADWLLRLCSKANLPETRIHLAIESVIGSERTDQDIETGIQRVTESIDKILADHEQTESALPAAPDSGYSDKELQRFAERDEAVRNLNLPYCDKVRGAITFIEVYEGIYGTGAVGPKLTPYR
jgi:hypothetical protein